jgi:hypothetical protein
MTRLFLPMTGCRSPEHKIRNEPKPAPPICPRWPDDASFLAHDGLPLTRAQNTKRTQGRPSRRAPRGRMTRLFLLVTGCSSPERKITKRTQRRPLSAQDDRMKHRFLLATGCRSTRPQKYETNPRPPIQVCSGFSETALIVPRLNWKSSWRGTRRGALRFFAREKIDDTDDRAKQRPASSSEVACTGNG